MQTKPASTAGIALGILLLQIGLASGGQLDPALLDAMQDLQPGEKVPVLIVMRDQGLSAPDLAAIQHLSHRKKRAAGRSRLQAMAAASQSRVRGFLRGLVERGQATGIQPLWMVDAIAARVSPERVYDLTAYGEVDRVLWDPPIPAEKLIDDLAPPGPQDPSSIPSEPHPERTSQIYWQLTTVKAPQAWALGFNGQEVVVAVVDTGVDYNHTDLRTHIYTNPGEIPGNGIDDDHNGFIDDVRGWDFVFNDNDPMGDNANDHGTKVAGIVAGDGTGGISTGVAPKARILPIKAVGGPLSSLLAGIDYAVLMDADVIQMSASQKWSDNPKPDFAAWRVLTDNELALGILHSNSIGNNGTHQDTDPIPFNIAIPGNCPSPWLHGDQYLSGGQSSVISVGAISQDLIAADYSSRGPADWEDIGVHYPQYPYGMPLEYEDYPYSGGEGGLIKPDLCAPGPGTLSTQLGGGYADFSGTSAASPHVAGAMAILLQANPELTPAQVDMILETTAVDLGDPGKDDVYGAGCLDVNAAVLKALSLAQYSTLGGAVTSEEGALLPHALVQVADPPAAENTNSQARYRFSVLTGGYRLITSAFGYLPDTSWAAVPAESTAVHNVKLTPRTVGSLAGTVRSPQHDPIAGVRVFLAGTPLPADTTGSDGTYRLVGIPAGVPLTLQAIRFNYHVVTVPYLATGGEADTLDLTLLPGLFDDFETDQGWTRDPLDTANMGRWERCDPVGTWVGTTPVQADSDFSPGGTLCYVTQNANPGAGPNFADVDGGTTTLISPLFDGTIYGHPVLSYRLWYSNNSDGAPNDVFKTDASSDGGASWVNLETIFTTSPAWILHTVDLPNNLSITQTMRLRFVASDLGAASTVEAGVDEVTITPDPSGSAPVSPPRLVLALDGCVPNPFLSAALLRFQVPQNAPARISLYDVQGRWVRDLVRGPLAPGAHQTTWDGTDGEGRRCASGVYLLRLVQAGQHRDSRVVLLR